MRSVRLYLLLGALTVVALGLATGSQLLGQNGASILTEAPAGFDNQPNGLVDASTFTADRGSFEQHEAIGDGLGPTYNAASCLECHANPVVGGISQVRELRAGHHDASGNFVAANATIADGTVTIPNRSLINQKSICPAVDTINLNGTQQTFNFPHTDGLERITSAETVETVRTSLNTLGDGFVESIADQTLLNLAAQQCNSTRGAICGQAIHVPVLEANGALAVGRFGWKDQHASLLSFSSDAYLNEMGISNRLPPNDKDVTTVCKVTTDPEDNHPDAAGLNDIDHFARFMRATKVPPRAASLASTHDAQAGAVLFRQIGCATCHVANITTAPPGTAVAAGAFTVPPSLGNKVIHPFSDFLLHDVGTGDGIVQNGPQDTANKLRTPPLWGVRLRNELMHDAKSLTFSDAIERHRGEANGVRHSFNELSPAQKNQLLTFLRSL
jgi:CxxC motif-containing protein (DUF1111 family)